MVQFLFTWSMSTPNISKSVLSTPRGTPKENENSEIMNCQLTPVLARFKVEQAVDEARSQIQKEAHQKRLKFLRKELDSIQSTAWKYEPIEKYIKF